jgi:protein O-GlcNAc transferase
MITAESANEGHTCSDKSMERFEALFSLLRQGRCSDVIAMCREIIAVHSGDPEILRYCASVARACGEPQSAAQLLKQAIELDSHQPEYYTAFGSAQLDMGRIDEATASFKKALALDPKNTAANYRLGLLYHTAGQPALSRDCFYRTILGEKSDWRVWGNLCMVLLELGEPYEAERAGRRAVSINGESYQAWHNLGNVYKVLEHHQKAKACYARAHALNPESDLTLTGLGICLQQTGDAEGAVRFFKMALQANPFAGTALNNLLTISMMQCDWQRSSLYMKLICSQTIESLRIHQVPAETPFNNLLRCDDPERNLEVAKAWSLDISKKMSETRNSLHFVFSKKNRRKIHIGYLSNNFRDHPTAHITRRLYGLHNKQNFKVFCFSYGPPDNSRYQCSIRKSCDRFIDISKMSLVEAAQIINGHCIDILVDLVGFMRGNRMAIAALRPAPIQVRWLGMAGTTGADFFDYMITDRTVTPKSQSRYYTEKLVYLPHCYQINDNLPFEEPRMPRRSEVGLPEGAFVFCCFNTSYKIDARIFEAWMRILKQSTGSTLWLMADSVRQRENLKKVVTASGIALPRIVFAEKVSKSKHLSRLRLADLALDTSLVNGAASTSDAIWAGVPVLTLQGNHFASRMSSSILQAAGLDELVATTLKGYERKAVTLTEEKGTFAQIRALTMQAKTGSYLFDSETFVHHLENAYMKIHDRYVDGKKPSMIDTWEDMD